MKTKYVVRANAKARPVRITYKNERRAIGGKVVIDKPGRGLFVWEEITDQNDLKYLYENGHSHLIDAVEEAGFEVSDKKK